MDNYNFQSEEKKDNSENKMKKEALAILREFLKEYKNIETEKITFQKSAFINETIKNKEDNIYAKIIQINNFILESFNDGINLDITAFKSTYFAVFSILTLRQLLFEYYNFIISNNLTNQEFNDYRNSVISKIPPFMSPLIDYLFPKEIYLTVNQEKEFLLLHPHVVNEEFKNVTKNDKDVRYLDLSKEIRSQKDRDSYVLNNTYKYNTEMYFGSSYKLCLSFDQGNNSRKYGLNNHSIIIKRKNAFVSDLTPIDVEIYKAWESEKLEEVSFWDETSVNYLAKPSISTKYINELDDDGGMFTIPENLEISEASIRSVLKDIRLHNRSNKNLRVEFIETNPRIRVPLNEETTLLYTTPDNYESYIFYGDYKLTFDFLPELYKFSVQIFNIIKENENIFINEYLKYLDNMIYKYNIIFSQLQQERLEIEKNEKQKSLELKK